MSNKLYVGNLSYSTTEQTLGELFGADGRNVSDVKVMMDRETGRPRGFAFVTMATEQDAAAAITALNEKSVDGRNLRVNEAQPQAPRTGGGGGGGGRGGGYGGGGGGGGGGRDRY